MVPGEGGGCEEGGGGQEREQWWKEVANSWCAVQHAACGWVTWLLLHGGGVW